MRWWHVEASDQPDRSFFKAVLIDWNFVRDNCTHPPTHTCTKCQILELDSNAVLTLPADLTNHDIFSWTQHDSQIQLACGLQTKEVATNTTQ